MRRKEKYIYLAGVIDSEGYIGITKGGSSPHQRSPNILAKLSVQMRDYDTIQLLRKTFRGRMYKRKLKSGNDIYCFDINGIQLDEIIEKVYPYLIKNKKVAKLVLRLRKHIKKYHSDNGSKKLTNKEIKLRQWYLKQSKLLHK